MSGKNWAIAIGINHYTDLQALKFADRDAVAVGEFLQQELAATVIRFAGDRPAPPPEEGNFSTLPTFGELRNFLRRRFEEAFLQPGDNLWFFFAGHGVRWGDRDYLMASDSDPGDPEATALPVSWIVERLRRSGADNVLLFIDACRTDGKRDGRGIGDERQQGVVTIFGCRPEQTSYELEDLEQGAFTAALLEGLRLHGEGNCATIDRLYQHLQQRVPELTWPRRKYRQVPYAIVEPPSKFKLILLPRRAGPADTEALKRAALQAEVNQRFAEAETYWIRVLAVGPDYEAIEAIKRLDRRMGGGGATPPRDPGGGREAVPISRRRTLQWLGYGGAGLVGSGLVYALTRPSPALPLQSFEVAVVKLDAQGKETVTSPDPKPQQFLVSLPGNVTLEMVQIPAGKFVMGSPDNEAGHESKEGPQREVSVPEFFMGRYPVTQVQWEAVRTLPKVKIDLAPNPSNFKGDRRPVEKVNWFETLEFCTRLSAYAKLGSQALEFRLPSEAEWEYACRAGTTTPFHFGPTITTDLANYRGTDWKPSDTTYPGNYGNGPKGKFREQTTDVGSFKKNEKEIANNFGLSDMHGNVWEWCIDWWFDNYDGAPTDGSARRDKNNHSRSAWAHILADWKSGQFDTEQAQQQRAMLRGGSWFDLPRYCRSASRNYYARAFRYNFYGFRVVCLPSRTPSP